MCKDDLISEMQHRLDIYITLYTRAKKVQSILFTQVDMNRSKHQKDCANVWMFHAEWIDFWGCETRDEESLSWVLLCLRVSYQQLAPSFIFSCLRRVYFASESGRYYLLALIYWLDLIGRCHITHDRLQEHASENGTFRAFAVWDQARGLNWLNFDLNPLFDFAGWSW